MQKSIPCLILSALLLTIISCSSKNDADTSKQDGDRNGTKATLVTITKVKNISLEMTEETVGSLEGITDPTIASEIAARRP